METDSLPSSNRPASIRVALVEDDASVRDILKSWIQEAADFTCVGAFPNAEIAITQIPRLAPEVMLLDINLPGQSGIDCVRILKPKLPSTQFVMLTVYEDSNHIFDALAAGATGYLLKYTPREALLAGLREVHAGGSPMTSNIARKVVLSLQQSPAKLGPADQLSKRESEVLVLLSQGYLYKEIADSLGLGLHTVNTYIRRIYEKLHVHSRAQAVAIYAKLPIKRDP